MDWRNHGAIRLPNAHLLDGRDIEDWRTVRRPVDAAGDFDRAPAVGSACEGFSRVNAAQTCMQVVAGSAPGDFVIEGKVETAAIERLLADLWMRADSAPAPAVARCVYIAITLNDRLYGGIEGVSADDARRHAEMAHSIQACHIEDGVKSGPRFEQHVGQFGSAQGVVPVSERNGGTERCQPGAVETRHFLFGAATEGNRIRLERTDGYAPLFTCRGSQARVEENGVRRRVSELAVVLAPRVLVVLRRSIGGGLVRSVLARGKKGAVEVQPRRHDGTTPGDSDPALVGFNGFRTRLALGHQVLRRERVFEAGRELVGAGPGRGIHGEAAAAVETDGTDPAALERHLIDIVARGFRRQRAEHGQRHIDAVEAIDIVLSAPARRRAADSVLRVLHAGRKLHQVAIVTACGHASHGLAVDRIGERGASAQPDALADHDQFLDRRRARRFKFDAQDGRLVQQHGGGQRLAGPVCHFERHTVDARYQLWQGRSDPRRRFWSFGRGA